jgi:hypothetical protein
VPESEEGFAATHPTRENVTAVERRDEIAVGKGRAVCGREGASLETPKTQPSFSWNYQVVSNPEVLCVGDPLSCSAPIPLISRIV